jgi:hypothetical protein
MLLTALMFELAYPNLPSLVLLVAPVAPLFNVAAAWSRHTDPASEIILATARAGLWLLLRRTLSTLGVLVPVLAVASWAVGQSPTLWLLPCLAFTTATLALGGRIGVGRAAAWLASGWVAAVVAPTLISQQTSFLLQPDSLPLWALATLALGMLVLIRADDYRRLTSRN